MKKMLILAIITIIGLCRPELHYGKVLDYQGNGILLDYKTKKPIDPYYNYIYYNYGYMPGMDVFTFCLLNPLDKEPDSIVLRSDFYQNGTFSLVFEK